MTDCHPDICPHMHFNKCYAERIRSIPNTIFPDPTIDSFTNVNVKVGNPYKSNIPTVAYENFNFFHEMSNDDRNFVKDFYMENYQQSKLVLNNNIVNQLKQDMQNRNAYVLAEDATKDYEQFQSNRKKKLQSARQRAKSAYTSHFQSLEAQKKAKHEQNCYWLKKLYRKLEEVARHIINGDGQDAVEKERQFLLSKADLSANFLSQIKITNPKNAHDILEEVRTLMKKKTLHFQDQRQEQQMNQSVSMSYTSEVSQNTSQGSMISEASFLSQSTVFGEDQAISKYCDFEQLRNKWNLEDIEDVKNAIRRVLTNKVVSDAQLQAVKNRRQAGQMNEKLLKMSGKQQPKATAKRSLKVPASFKKTLKTKAVNISTTVNKIASSSNSKSHLSKGEEIAKSRLAQGGRFDAIGQKLQRNRAYIFFQFQISDILRFSRKSKTSFKLSTLRRNLRESKGQRILSFNKLDTLIQEQVTKELEELSE